MEIIPPGFLLAEPVLDPIDKTKLVQELLSLQDIATQT